MPKVLKNIYLRSALCILISAFLLIGCEAPGALLYKAFGEPPVAAQYVPEEVPTLVLVENYKSPDDMQLDGDQIAHQVGDELAKETKLKLIDPDKLAPMREEDPSKYRKMSYQAIGKALEARQIILVDLLESSVTGDISQSVIHSHALAQVRVIDVTSGQTLWPTNASHGTQLEAKADYDPSDTSHAQAMHTEMISAMSSKIAKLFYKWKPDNQGQENRGG